MKTGAFVLKLMVSINTRKLILRSKRRIFDILEHRMRVVLVF